MQDLLLYTIGSGMVVGFVWVWICYFDARKRDRRNLTKKEKG